MTELGDLFHAEFLVRIPLQVIVDEFRSQFESKGCCLEIVSLTPHRLLGRGSVTFQ